MNNTKVKDHRIYYTYILYEYLRLTFGFLSIALSLVFIDQVSKFFLSNANFNLIAITGIIAATFYILWNFFKTLSIRLAEKLPS